MIARWYVALSFDRQQHLRADVFIMAEPAQSKHPAYYMRARRARDRTSSSASPGPKGAEDGLRLLRWVLEDYLEVDHDNSPVRDIMSTSVLKK